MDIFEEWRVGIISPSMVSRKRSHKGYEFREEDTHDTELGQKKTEREQSMLRGKPRALGNFNKESEGTASTPLPET